MSNAKKIQKLANGHTVFYEFDAQMGFWGIPGIEKAVCFPQDPDVPVLIKHNSDGNRDKEITLSQNEKTIVCMGGSHTWGAAVQQDSRYPDFLTAETGMKTVNMGHCSLGLAQVCLSIMQRTAKYNPKIIVIEQYPPFTVY
ncbi:MAG: hypothetical protein V4539_10755 [Bacteroidota bacterium]